MTAAVPRAGRRSGRGDRATSSRLRELVGTPHVMAVVKADAYGHGAVESARAAARRRRRLAGRRRGRRGLALREAGIDRARAGLAARPGRGLRGRRRAPASTSACRPLEQLRGGGRGAGRGDRPVFVQLKVETGLSRNGVAEADWDAVFARGARAGARAATCVVRGIFSHLSNASPEDDRAAIAVFERALARARGRRRSTPELRHIAASAAALDAAGVAVRPGAPRHRRLRAVAVRRWVRGRARPAPGDDPPRACRGGAPGARREGRLVRLHVPHRGRDDARAGPARVRRGHSAARLESGRRCRSAATPSGSAAASRWTSSWSMSATWTCAVGDEVVAVRRPRDRRPRRRRLGGRGRHHQLRDRHAARRPAEADLRRGRPVSAALRLPSTRRVATADEMHALGRELAAELRAGDLVVLSGPLGAGKTTLTRGHRRGAGRARPGDQPHLRARADASPASPAVRRWCTSTPTGCERRSSSTTSTSTSRARSSWWSGAAGCSTASRSRGWRSRSSGRPARTSPPEPSAESAAAADAAADVDEVDEPRTVTITGFGPRWAQGADVADPA